MARRGSRRGDSAGFTLTGFIIKLAFTVGIIVVILTLAQCSVKKPQAPTWDTKLIIPLVNRTYDMPELIRKLDQPGIGFDSDSNIIFSVSRDLDTFKLSQNDLSIGAISYSLSRQLGEVNITAPSIPMVSVLLSDISPLATGNGAVPPTNFSVNNDLPVMQTITTADISNGGAYVVISNTLGLDLSSVTVSLHDIGYGVPLGTQSLPGGLPNGSTDSVLFDLSGRTVSDHIRANLDCTTPGGTIIASGVQEVSTSVHFTSPFKVTAATAQIPALSRNFSQAMAIGKNTPVYAATLGTGSLSLNITNNTALASTVSITLPDIRQNGQPLVINHNILPGGNAVDNINLAGMILIPSDSTIPQGVDFQVVASSPGSGSNHIAVDQYQSFSVSAGISNLALESVTGVVPATDVRINPVVQNIDVPQGFDSVQIAHASLSFEITNAVDVPGSLSVQLQGNNGKSTTISGPVSRGTSGNPSLTVFIDSTIADFLWPLPSTLTVTGSATFGDGSSSGTLTNSDFVHAKVSITAPLELIIHQSTIEPDLSNEKLDSSTMDNVADHVTEAKLVYTLNNHLPIGAHFKLMLNGDSATAYSSPQVHLDDLFITAGTVNGSGVVTSAVSTGEQTVMLDSADIQVLRNPMLWIASQIVLDSSGSQPVKLTAQDYVGIVGRLEIQYRFDGKF